MLWHTEGRKDKLIGAPSRPPTRSSPAESIGPSSNTAPALKAGATINQKDTFLRHTLEDFGNVFEDSESSAHTFSNLVHNAVQDTSPTGMTLSVSLPILVYRWKRTVIVYEDEQASRTIKTLKKRRKKIFPGASAEDGTSLIYPPSIYTTPSLLFDPLESFNPTFMKLYRRGRLIRPAIGFPRGLLGMKSPRIVDNIFADPVQEETPYVTTEESGEEPFAIVSRTLCDAKIRFVIQFTNIHEFGVPNLELTYMGSLEAALASFDGVRMQWTGVSNIGSLRAHLQFALRLSKEDPKTDFHSHIVDYNAPPVAVYSFAKPRTFSITRKCGEFKLWEPAFKYADLIVVMGLILREQEQRNQAEGLKQQYMGMRGGGLL